MLDDNKTNPSPDDKPKKSLLLGLGLDGKGGEKRITIGENFLLTGGSQPTHELMQEKAIRFNEELKRRGRRLEDVDSEEFLDIADRIKMHERP